MRACCALIQRIARERNTGVVLCSHSLSEIEGICDDVVIMSSGTVIAQGEVQEILGKGNKNAFRVQVPAESTAAATAELEKISSVAKVSPNSNSPGWLNLEVMAVENGSDNSAYRDNNPLLQALIMANIPILTFEPAGNRLQDVFLQLTEEGIK